MTLEHWQDYGTCWYRSATRLYPLELLTGMCLIVSQTVTMKRSLTSRKKKENWSSNSYYAVSSDDDEELKRLHKMPLTYHTIVGLSTTGARSSTLTALATADVSSHPPFPTYQFDDNLHNGNNDSPDVLENFNFMDSNFFASWNEDHGLGKDGLSVEKRARTLEVFY